MKKRTFLIIVLSFQCDVGKKAKEENKRYPLYLPSPGMAQFFSPHLYCPLATNERTASFCFVVRFPFTLPAIYFAELYFLNKLRGSWRNRVRRSKFFCSRLECYMILKIIFFVLLQIYFFFVTLFTYFTESFDCANWTKEKISYKKWRKINVKYFLIKNNGFFCRE